MKNQTGVNLSNIVENKVLKEVITEFVNNNIFYWVTDGTALKLYRDNIVYPSSDFDFAMFSDTIPKVLEVCAFLKTKGYLIAYQNGLPFVEDFILVYPPKQCSFGPISFNFYHKNETEAFARNFNHPFRKEKLLIKCFALGFRLQEKSKINNKTMIQKIISYFPKPIRLFFSSIFFTIYERFAKTYWYVIPIEFFSSFKKIKLYDLDFYVPEDIENFLEYRYGSTWKTPIKNWNKFECQHVRIRKLSYASAKKYKVKCDIIEEDSSCPDVFAFSDDEIEQIKLRDLISNS